MTIEALRSFGADVDEGLARCMNNEAFYLKMVDMGMADERFDSLGGILESGDYDQAFEVCHALKGVVGNLALTPIYTPMSELTELLRAKQKGDYAGLYAEIKKQKDKLKAL